MKFNLISILCCFLCVSAFSQNYYSVKFPDDITLYGCGLSAPHTPPAIDQYGNCNLNVGVAFSDAVFNLNSNGTCKKVLRTWKLLDWCDYNPNLYSPTVILNPTATDLGPTVVGNNINHGYLEYTQVIKLLDNQDPIAVDCPTGTVEFCDYTGNDPAQYHVSHVDRCEGPVQLTARAFDACSKAQMGVSYLMYLDLDGNGSMETFKSSSDAGAWPILKTADADTLNVSVGFPAGFGLPYGAHKIEWIFRDDCGNEGICKYTFVVRDCKEPTVTCYNGLSVNMMQTGMISLDESNFLLYAADNCTPSAHLEIGIQKAGAGTDFPVNSHSLTWDCSELGQQFVEIWARDQYGNADFCETYVLVQDNMTSCAPQSISGMVMNLSAKPIAGIPLELTQTGPQANQSWTTETLADGVFEFEQVYGVGAELQASDLPNATGVTIRDALLTARHTLGIQVLGSPFALLAADANGDQAVSEADVEAMMQAIVQPSSAPEPLLIPADYDFPQPTNPFLNLAPKPGLVQNPAHLTDPSSWFLLRAGDVDGSAFAAMDAGKSGAPFELKAPNTSFQPGDEVSLYLSTQDLDGIAGFQFGITFDPAVLAYAGNIPAFIPENWIGQSGNAITACWNALTNGFGGKNAGYAALTLQFTALAPGTLSQAVTLAVPASVGYSYDMKRRPVALQWNPVQKAPSKKSGISTMQVSPNPTTGAATLFFETAESGPVRITETDAFGKPLHAFQVACEKGRQALPIRLHQGVPGWRFLKVETGGEVRTVRVMVE